MVSPEFFIWSGLLYWRIIFLFYGAQLSPGTATISISLVRDKWWTSPNPPPLKIFKANIPNQISHVGWLLGTGRVYVNGYLVLRLCIPFKMNFLNNILNFSIYRVNYQRKTFVLTILIYDYHLGSFFPICQQSSSSDWSLKQIVPIFSYLFGPWKSNKVKFYYFFILLSLSSRIDIDMSPCLFWDKQDWKKDLNRGFSDLSAATQYAIPIHFWWPGSFPMALQYFSLYWIHKSIPKIYRNCIRSQT